jgi:putative ABC transport system ATP-binding protein
MNEHRQLNKSFAGGPGAPRRGEPIRGGIVSEDGFHSTTFTWDLHLPPLAEKSPPGRRRQDIINTRDLTKIYRKGPVEIKAISGITLTIESGEFAAIMGPSGAGKSTLLHILGCLDRPTSGNYFLAGNDVAQKNDKELSLLRAEKIGFVFQTFNLLPNYTVLENVKMPFIYRSKENSDDREAYKKALSVISEMGILNRVSHFPTELSGGEQQRVAIARALAHEPDVLLADEPTGNLDSKTGSEIIEIFKKLNHSGVTILMVTHNTQLARIAARRIYIKDGIIEKED